MMNTLKPIPGCGWMLFSNPLEVLPADDMFVHVEGLSCWCVPAEDEEGTIIHNAADGREMFETGQRKVS
jgi:hypothetical protein